MAAPLPFFRLPFSVNAPSAPIVGLANIKPLLPLGPELDAGGHWLLGGGAGSLADVLSGQPLTQGGTAPSFLANYVTTASGSGNGLLTPFDDSATETLCIVAQRPAGTPSQIVGGTLTSNSAAGGSGLFWGPALQVNTRGFGGTTLTIPAALVAGSWYFAAVAHTPTERRVYIGGNASGLITSGAKAAASPARKVALGNGGYGGSTLADAINAAELIYYPRALTVAEMQAVYERSKFRMADRGIAVV